MGKPYVRKTGTKTCHHRVRAFARRERGLENALGRIIGHRDEARPGLRR
jgi:hypothetical protein